MGQQKREIMIDGKKKEVEEDVHLRTIAIFVYSFIMTVSCSDQYSRPLNSHCFPVFNSHGCSVNDSSNLTVKRVFWNRNIILKRPQAIIQNVLLTL